MRSTMRVRALLALVAILASACGSSGADPDAGSSHTDARVVRDSGGSVDATDPEVSDSGPVCACSPVQVCRMGACECPTASDTYCLGVGACVSTAVDPSHCGGCGNVCPVETTCEEGTCRCGSPTRRYCPGARACIDVSEDDGNCGACDAACPPGATCVASTCACADSDRSLCSDGCRDLMSDGTNCGSCGATCSATEVCRGGVCACVPSRIGLERQLTAARRRPLQVAIATDGTYVAAVYSETRSGVPNVVFQLLDDEGAPLGMEIALSSLMASGTFALYPGVAWTGVEWAVVWYERAEAPTLRSDLLFQRLTRIGVPIGAPRSMSLLPGDGTEGPRVDGLRVAHSSTLGVVVVGGDLRVNFIILGDGSSPSPVMDLGQKSLEQAALAAAPTGEVGVAWAQAGGVNFQLVGADGRLSGPVVEQVDPRTWPNWYAFAPAVAHTSAGFIVAFYERSSAPTDNHRMSACIVGACDGRTSLWANTSPPDRQVEFLRIAVQGEAALLGWQRAGIGRYLEALRFGLTSGFPVISPRERVNPTDTVNRFPWGLTWSSPGRAVAAWTDSRWGAAELYDIAIESVTCP